MLARHAFETERVTHRVRAVCDLSAVLILLVCLAAFLLLAH
jgi:hypothetical protein